MKAIYVLLIASIFLCSCSTYTAVLKKHDDLGNEAIRAYPTWKYKDPGAKKIVVPLITTAAAAAYGYKNETTIDNKTYTKKESAAMWGGGGMLVGSLINAILFPSRNGSRTQFDLKQSEKWVRNFNQSTGKDYVISKKELNNTLVLVPERKRIEARNEFRVLEKDLKRSTPTISFSELQSWKNRLEGKHYLLPPSEIAEMKRIITNYEVKIANKDLLSKMYDVDRLPLTLEVLSTLKRVKSSNQNLYNHADSQTRIEFDGLVKEKTRAVLRTLMQEEKREFDLIESSLVGLRKVNLFTQKFEQKYGNLLHYEIVEDTRYDLIQKAETIVSTRPATLKVRIANFGSIAQIEKFEKNYLSDLNYNQPAILDLKKQLNDRRDVILQEQKRKQLAIKEARRKKRENWEYENEKRAISVVQSTKLVKRKRQELRIKYESNLPTYDDLYEIMNLAGAIKDKAYQKDQDEFISRVERMGYMLVNDELFSDRNVFRNSKGFEIYTFRTDDNYGNQTSISANFSVPNASRDLIELYANELNSTFRKRNSSLTVPRSSEETLKTNSEFYVRSGGTFYFYSVKDGKLKVTAFDNSNAKGLVVAERLDYNTLQVTPWSNYTDITLNKGDVISIGASGSISLGVFSVACYPDGISGFRTFNVDSRFNHGCLMGKIGEGDWFYIGSRKTITASSSGKLQLRINDDREYDNSGAFRVKYSIQPVNSND